MLEADARTMVRQIVAAVDHIHKNGYCHLDLSPENILLGHNLSPNDIVGDLSPINIWQGIDIVVGDFGSSKAIGNSPFQIRAGQTRPGKIQYMAPEVFQRQSFHGTSADIYSVGVVLFVMLTGFPPYKTPSEEDSRFRSIVNGSLRKLLLRWEIELSDQVIDLMSRLLQPESTRLTMTQLTAHPWMQDIIDKY